MRLSRVARRQNTYIEEATICGGKFPLGVVGRRWLLTAMKILLRLTTLILSFHYNWPVLFQTGIRSTTATAAAATAATSKAAGVIGRAITRKSCHREGKSPREWAKSAWDQMSKNAEPFIDTFVYIKVSYL
jgi:hypothetical protein